MRTNRAANQESTSSDCLSYEFIEKVRWWQDMWSYQGPHGDDFENSNTRSKIPYRSSWASFQNTGGQEMGEPAVVLEVERRERDSNHV